MEKNRKIASEDNTQELKQNLMLINLERIKDYRLKSVEIKYDSILREKVLYPSMINIGHAYAYYHADEAMQDALKDKIDLSPAVDEFSVLKQYLTQEPISKDMVNSIVKAMLKNPIFEDMNTKAQTISAQCEIKHLMRPFEQNLTELNKL